MPRAFLTALGVLPLLPIPPPPAGAAELVRPGISSSLAAPPVDTQTGVAPRQHSWTTAPSGAHITTGAPSRSTSTPAALTHAAGLAGAEQTAPPASSLRVLPDARAPPA